MKLIETVTFEGSDFHESEGVKMIRNVVLLGPVSKHGYTYRPEAMRRAVPLYERVRAFIDHPTADEERSKRRDVQKLAGQFINVRFEEGKIKGDIKLLPDECGQKFWNIARHMPNIASCSHMADGKMVTEGGHRYVEEISRVWSVDLVVEGATTASVFESTLARIGSQDHKTGKPSLKEARATLVGATCRHSEGVVDLVKARESLLAEHDPYRLNLGEYLRLRREGVSESEAYDLAHRR
jgi:hypothetical protein